MFARLSGRLRKPPHVGEGSRDDIQKPSRAGVLVRGGSVVMSGEWTGWERRESGPADAVQAALLLPGGMCTAVQYEELMAEPALAVSGWLR